MSERIIQFMNELFEPLDLLGPADSASTRRALAWAAPGEGAAVLDLGCGTGRQTLQLLQESRAMVTAIDRHQAFLERLLVRAERVGVAERLRVVRGDMGRPPVALGSLDVIWCEGAIYNVGYEEGLRAWRPLLRLGGYLCVTEAAYLVEDPPAEVRGFWEPEYPGISTREGLEQTARDCGYLLVDSFVLPASAWDAYVGPVERRLDELEASWSESPDGRRVLAAMRHEVEFFRRHDPSFGYVFLVLQKPAE